MPAWAKRAMLAVVVAAVTFSVLWWGATGMGWWRQDRPVERVLAQTPEVLSYDVAWQGDILVATVVLAPGVDLPGTFARLDQQLSHILGERKFRLLVNDGRNGELAETYRVMRLYLEEAVASGRYTWAEQKVREIASQHGLDWARLSIDEERLYLELQDGTAYLYAVVARHPMGG